MGYIEDMLLDERNRLLEAQKAYEADLASLPKGVIIYKKIRNRKYPYLSWREGSKTKTKYIKNDNLRAIKDLVFRRQRAELALRNIKENLYTIEHGVGNKLKQKK